VSIAAALGTVAVVARSSTAAEFTRYVDGSRKEMQAVAEEIASSMGDRLVVTSPQGRVILDSSGELLGQTLTPDAIRKLDPAVAPPVPSRVQAGVDVLFVRRTVDATSTDIWSRPVARGEMLPLLTEDREQLFVSAVSRSLLMGVLVGGGVAVALALAFARGILRPIGALTHAAQKLEQGDLGQRVSVHSKDEIGQLAHAFNAMADGLARNERLRHSMVTDVAHELRTPLTNLRGYLEAMRDGVTPISSRVVDSLYEEAMLLSHLVDDLQDLTLSEAGRLRLQRDTLDVREVLESAAQGVAQRAAEAGVRVSVAAAAGLSVSADRQRMGQVLRNLLSNALRHTAAGGTVELRAAATGGGVRFEISDTGSGIPPEHLPNVFERFYRADPSRTRATGGAGIGLAVVKQLVEAHGAKIEVHSVEGEGSTFRFTLPYRAPGHGANALATPRSALLSAG
jgi:signal transduction histidine kinase